MEPESSGGSVSIRLQSDIMRDAPAGYDGELKLRFFADGVLDSLVEYSGGGASPTVIAYLGAFPSSLGVGGSSIITVPFNYGDSQLSVQNVPSDKKLNVFIEYYGDGTLDPYYLAYAGLSDSFELSGGETAEVSVTLVETQPGTITVNNGSGFTGTCYMFVYEPTTFDSDINIDTPDPGTITFNSTSSYLDYYAGTESAGVITFPDAIMPGKKIKIVVTQYNSFNMGVDHGLSDTFEVQPGRTLSVPVSYYLYTS